MTQGGRVSSVRRTRAASPVREAPASARGRLRMSSEQLAADSILDPGAHAMSLRVQLRNATRRDSVVPESFRERVENDINEARAKLDLRTSEHTQLAHSVDEIETLVDELSRSHAAASSGESPDAPTPAEAAQSQYPRRIGHSAEAVVDPAAQAKITQLHSIISGMANETAQLRARLAASEFQSNERADRVAELEAEVLSLKAQLAGVELPPK